ncbi:MAG TPA: magnesium transporter CorA family protein [Alphaproteobacteria bacterium]|nr:magnesium transporter CorA family protein [Alphaproteobacteria bacterium]
MITAYTRKNGKVASTEWSKGQPLPSDTIWVDLFKPEDGERDAISQLIGASLPTMAEMQEIETSSRFYVEGDALFMTIDVVAGAETPNPILDVLLIAQTPKCLVTTRYSELCSIATYTNRIKQQSDLFATSEDGLLTLLDAITDRIADILETLGRDVENLSQQIFKIRSGKKEKRMQDILGGVGHAGSVTHKIRGSIEGMTRLLSFLAPRLSPRLNADQMAKLQAVKGDAAALSDHAQFVAQETSFLLDATLGQINVEQNNILKIMSVVMVAFTPPTFLASLWGMNFHDIPEYNWAWGYPMAWAVMIVTAIIPVIYFKKKGWF